jgi:hypothetical protein
VVVFDEGESFVTEQSKINYSTLRKQFSQDNNPLNQTQSIINSEILQLN